MSYKRKYRKGAKITSLDELWKQEFIYVFDKITHWGWFHHWQFYIAQRHIKRGWVYYAERITDDESDMGTTAEHCRSHSIDV